MIRRTSIAAAVVACALLAPGPARAANKDIERLALQIATLQGQLAEIQRSAEESRAELRRLTELVAEQNALLYVRLHQGLNGLCIAEVGGPDCNAIQCVVHQRWPFF